MIKKLTKQIMETAFNEVGRLAAERGLMLEIAVFGGSCLILASSIRESSGDVDAVFLNNRTAAYEIIKSAAHNLSLPSDWLNEGVKRMAFPPGNPGPNLFPYGDYPKDVSTTVGLRVLLPSPEYMLAMKLLASRAPEDVEKIRSDREDMIGLMSITGIKTAGALESLMNEVYPEVPGLTNPISAKMKSRIDRMVKIYDETIDKPDATWNASRGPATNTGK